MQANLGEPAVGVSDPSAGRNRTALESEDEIVRSLRQIMRAVDLRSRRLVEEYGLTGPQLVTLQEVQRQGRVASSALARAVHLSGPTMTGILSRLQNRGLVTRSRGARDRRTVKVEITEAGQQVLERAPSPLQDTFRRNLSRLEDWERLQVLATLKRVASMMDAEAIDAAPVLEAGALGPASAIQHTSLGIDGEAEVSMPSETRDGGEQTDRE